MERSNFPVFVQELICSFPRLARPTLVIELDRQNDWNPDESLASVVVRTDLLDEGLKSLLEAGCLRFKNKFSDVVDSMLFEKASIKFECRL